MHGVLRAPDVEPAVRDVVEYCQESFFCFVPNVCNAKCNFCYVSPAVLGSAHLADGVLRRATKLFEAMSAVGFREVRFTGGEPLLFDNFDCLAEFAVASGLKYTVLTNGIALKSYVE